MGSLNISQTAHIKGKFLPLSEEFKAERGNNHEPVAVT
jgi:hypothetical protein